MSILEHFYARHVHKNYTMTDLQIAKGVSLKHISTIAEKFGIDPENIEMFGKYKAKLPLKAIDREKAQESNLILVSAISPTPAGEGKTTMSIGLSEGLNRLGKKSTVVLRNKRGCHRRRLFPSIAHGRHQPTFYG
jgi:formyltetrahydrofolate synthetase